MSSADANRTNGVQPPIGIDLGTTYSVIAHLDSTGRPTTILNSEGETLTPSAILFDEDNVVVGREAARASVMEPDAYAECFKRDIGGSVFHRKVVGVDVPPEVLSAFVLERLKEDAERRLGVPIRKAVITVPAFFDETRRKATQDAGRLAGLDVLDLINEPTAAAIAYAHQHAFFDPAKTDGKDVPTNVLVYDLGGGTFDVTILRIHGHQLQALATDGDVKLGGKDFDERLVDYLAEQFAEAQGVDVRSDPQDAAQIWLDAQETKHTLSGRSRAMVTLAHAGKRARGEVTREKFEELTQDLLSRTETTTSLTLKQADLDWSQIDRVLLVGGSSRMPMVADMLRRLSGKEPDRSASPDEAVAHGAALYAAMLMNQGKAAGLGDCTLANVNSHSLGVVGLDPKTRRRQNAIVIPKNTALPCRVARMFKTAKENQRSIVVAIVEGESYRPEDCIALGRCVIQDLPEGLPMGTPIQVEFSYAANGRITVSARVPSVRQSAHVEIEREQERDLENLNLWRSRLCGSADPETAVAPDGADIDLSDATSVLRRLDCLHIRIGRAAAEVDVPFWLRRSQKTAKAADGELRQAHTALELAEKAKRSAGGTSEAVQLGSEYARAKNAYEQAQTQSDFAYLDFGRKCLSRRFHPSGLAAVIEETKQLQSLVQG